MKTFSLCILATSFVCLWAAPAWYDLLPATSNLEKGGVGAIWNDCSKRGDALKLVKVEIKPAQPKQGQNFTILATIQLKEDITGGKIEFSMDYGRVPIFSKTLDLCAGMELLNIGLTCPISAGTYEKSARIHIPFGLPEGDYQGHGKIFDQNKNELLCFGFNVRL